MRLLGSTSSWAILVAITIGKQVFGQTEGFGPSNISPNGILTVQATDAYYDGANGTLFTAIPLPAGASRFQFRVTGGVITDGSQTLASADGLYASGQTPYNWTATDWKGTYNGVPLGATTGVDPSLFGVFFNPASAGPTTNSANFRSDTGLSPDPRTLLSYSPAVNQPFYIGDGYTGNNPYVTNVDSFTPEGTNQTFLIPAGATHLLLGIGSDPNMGDNKNASNTNSAFVVHVFDDVTSTPVIGAINGYTPALYQGASCSFSVALSAGSAPVTYRWLLNGVDLADNARISGARSNILNLTALQAGDSGIYQVVVSNSLGQVSSNLSLAVYGSGQGLAYTNVTIPGNAEIFGAGNAGLPDATGGVNPILVNLPANSLVVSFSNVGGQVSLNGGGAHNDPDGVVVSGAGYPVTSFAGAYGGLSGIRIPGAGALVGVFETGTAVPTVGIPFNLDFSASGTGFNSLAPALYQTFFIGDGQTGDGSGSAQQFIVPPGATQLFLGIPDARGFNNPPGGYGDNSGAFTASVQVLVPGPQLIGPELGGPGFSFSVQTAAGQSYTVQQCTSLSPGNWSDYTNYTGDGSLHRFTLPVGNQPAQFFRVRQP